MFDEDDMFENIFAAINFCPKLGDAMFNEADIFSLPSFDENIYYDESMPPIYDDYCDDTYAIKKKFAYVESSKISMQVDHEKNALCAGYIVELIHDATENYYEGGTYACRNCKNTKFPVYELKILKLCLFCLSMLVDYCSHKLFAHKIPMHRKCVRLKCASHILHDALFMFQFLSFM